MVVDSATEADMLKLMDETRADYVNMDPPYILDYLNGKTKQKDNVCASRFRSKEKSKYMKYILKEETTIEKRELLANSISRIQYKDKILTLIDEY